MVRGPLAGPPELATRPRRAFASGQQAREDRVELGPSRVDEGIVRACDRVAHGLAQTLTQGLPSSARASTKAEQAFLLYWSTLHGYAMLLIDHKLDDLGLSLDELCAKLCELLLPLFKGLGIAARVSTH